jgi:hypothetical protein
VKQEDNFDLVCIGLCKFIGTVLGTISNSIGTDVTASYALYELVFTKDGSVSNTIRLTGSSTENSVAAGTWKLSDKTLTLVLNGSTNVRTIEELTDTSLKFSNPANQSKTALRPK